ncbi:MAG: 1-acyl-sn-glycerol-3-phosphate acyltransferase [Patiriisocius sp.]
MVFLKRMKLLTYPFIILYRIWFYILLAIPILAMFPFLLISTLKQTWYPTFFKLSRVWAAFILYGMGLIPKIKRETIYQKKESYMFVSNHTSMTDIMLMLYVTQNPFVFVGKKELGKIPLFGFFYKRTCILVDRNNPKSRREVFESAQRRLSQGLSICIFPEGGVPEDTRVILDTFKDGAFRLAIEHQIPIAPIVFHDNKKHFSYDFFSGSPGRLRVKTLPLIPTKGEPLDNKRAINEITRNVILQELKNPTV